jgi:hypothetical protein
VTMFSLSGGESFTKGVDHVPVSRKNPSLDEIEFDEGDLYGDEHDEDVHSSEVDVSSGVVLPLEGDSDEDQESGEKEEGKGGLTIPTGAKDSSSDVGSLPKFSPRASHRVEDSAAMSLPGTHFMSRFHSMNQEIDSSGLMGTSAPIRIPKAQRTAIVNGSPGVATRKGLGGDFVPPHLLDNADDPGFFSPSTSIKREKLVARNAILRSTGFIEIKQFTAPTGEIIDAVKESVMPEQNTAAVQRTVSSSLQIPSNQKEGSKPMASSLTALLSSSK